MLRFQGCGRAAFALYLIRLIGAGSNAASEIDEIHRRGGRPPRRGDADRHGSSIVAVYLAGRPDRFETARAVRRPSDGGGEARDDRHPLRLQMGDRRAGGRPRRRQDSVARLAERRRRADDHLRRAARSDGAVHPGARRAVRRGRDERGAPPRHRGLRPSAPIVAALSSRAQDRRPDARSRARPQRDRDDHPPLDADGGADRRRVRADPRRVPVLVRLALRRRGLR